MFSIGQLSKRTGVKISTIRYYEHMKLLPPAGRSRGNQRRYSKDGLSRLSFIIHSRQLGFSIEDVRSLLTLAQYPEKTCEHAHKIAADNLDRVRKKMKKLKRLEKELKRIIRCDGKKISECSVIEKLTTQHQSMG